MNATRRLAILAFAGAVAGLSAQTPPPAGPPYTALYVFGDSDSATSGGPYWMGRWSNDPTALGLPRVDTGDTSFGVQTNEFGFTITWARDKVLVVEVCADLANPIWTPVTTHTLVNGSAYFSDPQWADDPARFYRLSAP